MYDANIIVDRVIQRVLNMTGNLPTNNDKICTYTNKIDILNICVQMYQLYNVILNIFSSFLKNVYKKHDRNKNPTANNAGGRLKGRVRYNSCMLLLLQNQVILLTNCTFNVSFSHIKKDKKEPVPIKCLTGASIFCRI